MNRRLPLVVMAILISSGLLASEAAVDRAARVEQVRAAEIAFAKSVMDDRPELFASFLDPDTVFVSGANLRRGKAAVVESWKGFFGAERPYFEWHPEIVELSADGNLGFSRGPWVIRSKDKDGKEAELRGIYNSVWQRQSDGSWRIIFDAGCSPCPACS